MVGETILGLAFSTHFKACSMGLSFPIPWAALKFLQVSRSLGRVKVKGVWMGAWERDGGGRVGTGRAQRMPSACKRTWHAIQSGILYHPGEEVLGRDCYGMVNATGTGLNG